MQIDYVIPFVDCTDPNWQTLYNQHTHNTILSRRYRDNGTLKYQLRGIEKNFPWVNKVFIIVQSPSQIPKWLRVDHPKISIVYHNEYIPNEYLPTFNSVPIELNIHRIKELSNTFILSNDDILPIKPQESTNYFVDDRPVQTDIENTNTPIPCDANIHQFMLYKMFRIEQLYLNRADFRGLLHTHLLHPYNKAFWADTFNQYKYTLNAACHEQYYRGYLQMNHWFISDMQVLKGFSIINNNLNTIGKINIHDNINKDYIYDIIRRADVICMNDDIRENTELLNTIPTILDSILPDKSSFEL